MSVDFKIMNEMREKLREIGSGYQFTHSSTRRRPLSRRRQAP